MPVSEMLVDSAAGYEYLSMLDGYSGYNHIFIAEEDVSKTAFRCPGAIGTYEWIVMPFGLKNVGAAYQRAMNSIFHDYIETFMQAGDFLGFVVHKKGIEINQNKTKAIMETKAPSTKKELQSLLRKPIMHIRVGKWALALTEYSLAFMPLRAMKEQIVSDFIVDHAVVESPQLQVELKP
ncbi:uncharacterized protein LOC127095832 [Lathyrus oleraceus]|uniref:uncharacterized protein LOC127095832 n=1 Tax=Pisum sativum TaxID=3888 RepID=UPI0021D2425C|nr:uncharacterized protein LOC127095832 [Pisum sativum]